MIAGMPKGGSWSRILAPTAAAAAVTTVAEGRSDDDGSMTADGAADADEPQMSPSYMYMTMTMMRPGLFLQREGPGSEPGNSLVCPDGHV